VFHFFIQVFRQSRSKNVPLSTYFCEQGAENGIEVQKIGKVPPQDIQSHEEKGESIQEAA